MKKILFALSTGLITVTAFGNNVFRQNYGNPDTFINNKKFVSSVRHLDSFQRHALKDIIIPIEKNITIRAYKDFQARYHKAENAMWYYDSKDGFECYFLQNGYGNRAIYDKNGRWQYSLIMYGEEKLPRDIRASVKSTYFDFDITLVEEIQMPKEIDYVVYLIDKSNIKILKVNNEGEIKILQELAKE